MVDPRIQVDDQNVPSRETLPVKHSTFWISETIQFSTVHVVKKKSYASRGRKRGLSAERHPSAQNSRSFCFENKAANAETSQRY